MTGDGSESGSEPGTGGGPGNGGPPDPRAEELRELRERLARLERSEAAPPHAGAARHWRAAGSVVLIVLAAVLSLPAVLAVWASEEVSDTDRYVATVAPLAGNPQVRTALTDRVSAVVIRQVDVPALVDRLSKAVGQSGVPPQAAALVTALRGPISDGLDSVVHAAVSAVVDSDAFATVWTEANRTAHTAVVKALTGQGGGAVQLKGDRVTIDLSPVIAKVKNQLVASGFGLAAQIPAVHTDFTVFSSPDLAKYRTWFRLLQIAGGWLPLVAVVIAAIGVLLAHDRRRALVGAAFGVAAAMLVLGLAIDVFRAFYLDRLPPGTSPEAAGAIYDALVRFLRGTARAVGVLALAVAIGGLAVGPSRAAVTVRAACTTGITGVRRVAEPAGLRVGRAEPFVRRHKRLIGWVILLVAAGVFVAWSHPTAMVVVWFAVVVLAAFGIREFLAPGAADRAGHGDPAQPPA